MNRARALALLACCTWSCGSDSAPPELDTTPSESSSGHTGSGGRNTGGAAPASNGGSPSAPEPSSDTGGAEPAISGGRAAAGGSFLASGGRAQAGAAGAASPCDDPNVDFEARCQACAEDACARCVCSECTAQAEQCEQTEGCSEIAACALETGCTGAACYCGTADPLRCLSGEADGPCKDVILSLPGGREPTLTAPSAGPASDAATALSQCSQPPAGLCAAECS